MIWAIALRNLWQHKAKTFIIGALVTIGIMLSFAGNAFIDSVIGNISRIFTDYYTGDILITSTETLGAGVFGTSSSEMKGFPVIPTLADYDEAMRIVGDLRGVKAVTRQLSGYAIINLDRAGMEYACFFGVEPESYFKAMPGIEILSGRLLTSGEEGILLHYDIWKRIKETRNVDYKVGDRIQLNCFGSGGLKIREVPIVGIFKFPYGNKRLFPMSFLDARTLSFLLGKNAGTAEKVDVAPEASSLLDADIDSLFSDATPETAGGNGSVSGNAGGALTAANVFDILGSSESASPLNAKKTDEVTPSPHWHFILIRCEDGVNVKALIKDLNKKFDERDLLLRAQGWWVSATPDSLTYSGFQLLFNVAIFILGFVSIIIIMNTLVVSVMERTSEIGTMRALGARKSFIARLFIAETGILTFVFGIAGMALGAIAILILNRVGIQTDTDALRFLGGGVLRPSIDVQSVVLSLSFMCLIALTSWIYPVLVALRISPVKAISAE